MTTNELAKELGSRFKDVSATNLLDIVEVLKGLPQQAVGTALDLVRTKWKSNSCPRSGWFAEELAALGYGISQFTRDHSGAMAAAWTCADCGAKYYPLTVYFCPKCESIKTAGVCDAVHPAAQFVDEESTAYKNRLCDVAEARMNGLSENGKRFVRWAVDLFGDAGYAPPIGISKVMK